jgi:hypothetical protein
LLSSWGALFNLARTFATRQFALWVTATFD